MGLVKREYYEPAQEQLEEELEREPTHEEVEARMQDLIEKHQEATEHTIECMRENGYEFMEGKWTQVH